MTVHLIVLAGGRGERLRPWTSRALPKPCLRPEGVDTLLEGAVDRFARVVDGVHVIASAPMIPALMAAAPRLPPRTFIAEPGPKGTGAAVALGLRAARAAGAEQVIISPADHIVGDASRFAAAALAASAVLGGVGLVGLTGCASRDGLGWILPGAPDGQPGLPVDRFVEKPAREAREALVSAGAMANSGLFAGRVDRMIDALALAPGLARLASCPDEAVQDSWGAAPRGAFDRLVLEAGAAARVFAYAGPWSDVGTWPEMAEALPHIPQGRGIVRGGGSDVGAEHLLIVPDRAVEIRGLPNLLVVDDGETLHIRPRPGASIEEEA